MLLDTQLAEVCHTKDSGTPQYAAAHRSPEMYVRRGVPDYQGIRTTEGKCVVEVTYAASTLGAKVTLFKAGIFYLTAKNNNNNNNNLE